MEGSFQCSCNEGFTLSASGDTCIDTDECTAIPNTCGDGTCINTFGSYRCRCFYGFQMSSDNNCQGSIGSVPHTDRQPRPESKEERRIFGLVQCKMT